MSATPVPRTLALILYGDLEISVVDELPPGRKPVRTRIVPPEKREDMYRYVREQAVAGRQAYVVCPLIEESDKLDAEAAVALHDELKEGRASRHRHGAHTRTHDYHEEKEDGAGRLPQGESMVLVSTTL